MRGFEPLGVQNITYTHAPESVVVCQTHARQHPPKLFVIQIILS
nr:MAG TPA: hypothetical protein [Caudoviricetes sp.]